MNILVYGAGVLGSLYAARLQEAGQNVTVLARGERLEQVRRNGIILEDGRTGRQTVTPVRAVPQLEPAALYDLAIVLVRKDQLASVLPALAANRQIPHILFMTNNAAGPEELIRAVGRERVILGFPGAGGARIGPVVRYHVGSGTTIGELGGQVTPRLKAIARLLEGAGFPVAVSPRMDAWLKTHVALVSPIAGAFYMAGDNYKLAADPEGLRLMLAAIREGLQVLEALGIPITPPRIRTFLRLPDWILVPILRRSFATERAELVMMRHAAVARAEMQVLAAEFRMLALRSGLPTPALERLGAFAA